MKTEIDEQAEKKTWLSPQQFAFYIQSDLLKVSPLKGLPLQEQLESLSSNSELSSSTLVTFLEDYISLNPVSLTDISPKRLKELAPVSFAVRDGLFLPSSQFASIDNPSAPLTESAIYMAAEKLPQRKLSKTEFVGIFTKGRQGGFLFLLAIGIPPVLLSVVPELLQQPLFDSFIPEGRIPSIFLVGVATIAMQMAGQVISSVSQLYQSLFNDQIDLATRTTTALRFLQASSQSLPVRDVGSWRISLQVSSSFLGSLQALVVSIPLALISLVVNLVVIGGFTDPAGAVQLFFVLLIPTVISLIITLFSSNIYIKIMGQQSRLESIIFDVVKQIRAISLLGTQDVFITRFERSRQAIAESMIRSGLFSASAEIVGSISTALLYSFIFLQYYNSVTAGAAGEQSVGSLLVIYFAVGTIGGALGSISQDLVSIIQTLPTYWTPNPLRDASDYRTPQPQLSDAKPSLLVVKDLVYLAQGLDEPFPHPINFSLQSPGKIAIMGPSGCGKSTLLRLLTGNLTPKQGEVLLYDSNSMLLKAGLSSIRTLVISQEARLFGSTLREVLDPQGIHTTDSLESAAEKAGLTSILESLPLRWKTPVSEYSRDLSLGQLQLFKLSRVLLGNYTVVITDEPTCHLPEEMHLQSLRLINDNCDMHISTLHRSSGLQLFDTVVSISKDGKVEVSQ